MLPAGTVAEVLGDRWEVAAAATSLGVQPLFDRRTDSAVRWAGQAGRAWPRCSPTTSREPHDMVVLDEPTNHLDLEAIEWLEARLVTMKAALVLVTHDRHALDRLTTAVGPSRVVELDGGRAFIHQAATGTSAYATYLDARAERIDREAAGGVDAQDPRSQRTRVASARCAGALDEAEGATAQRATRSCPAVRQPPACAAPTSNSVPGTTRLGNQVVELVGVTQRFGDHTVFDDIDLLIEPGARLAVVGPNGSGKSTLLDIIAGRAEPVSGHRPTWADTVVVGYADQHSSTLDPDAIVRKLVAGPHREPDHEDKALLERFWFDSTAQYAPVRMLSGGERRRLQLVMVLATKPNLLILDEPTNDLDLDTLRVARSVPRRLAGGVDHRKPRPRVPRPGGRPRAGHRSGRHDASGTGGRVRMVGRAGCIGSSPHLRVEFRSSSCEFCVEFCVEFRVELGVELSVGAGCGPRRHVDAQAFGAQPVDDRSTAPGNGASNGEGADAGRDAHRPTVGCDRS